MSRRQSQRAFFELATGDRTAGRDSIADRVSAIATSAFPLLQEDIFSVRESPLNAVAPFLFRPLRFVLDLDVDDTIIGTPRADELSGGVGDDDIFGRGSDDLLDGGVGNDVLFGEAGNDELRGGEGDDDLFGDNFGDEGDDTLEGGPGDDDLYGFAGDDDLDGGPDDDDLYGGSGDDDLIGGSGNDDLFGGDGNDDLRGGPGNDLLAGGAGNDIFMKGGSGDDTLEGGSGNDDLAGGTGVDLLEGGSGNDTLRGNDAGNIADNEVDTLIGGFGDDVYYNTFSREDEIIELANQGTGDTLIIVPAAGESGQVRLMNEQVFENGSVINQGFGFLRDDPTLDSQVSLFGTGMANRLGGSFGGDRIFGLGGNDTIDGGFGADVIDAGNGDDTIFLDDYELAPNEPAINRPAQGKTLTGGQGADTFVLRQNSDSPASDPDIITDFTPGEDKLDLSAALPDNFIFVAGNTNATNEFFVAQVGDDVEVRVDSIGFAMPASAQPINIVLLDLQADQITVDDFIL